MLLLASEDLTKCACAYTFLVHVANVPNVPFGCSLASFNGFLSLTTGVDGCVNPFHCGVIPFSCCLEQMLRKTKPRATDPLRQSNLPARKPQKEEMGHERARNTGETSNEPLRANERQEQATSGEREGTALPNNRYEKGTISAFFFGGGKMIMVVSEQGK